MAILMSKLTGVSIVKPRRKTGYQIWRPTHAAVIDSLVDERAEAENVSGRKKIGLRTKVCKELYDELDSDEKEEWELKAQEQYDETIKRIKDMLELPPSTQPLDRQKYVLIQGYITIRRRPNILFQSYFSYSELHSTHSGPHR